MPYVPSGPTPGRLSPYIWPSWNTRPRGAATISTGGTALPTDYPGLQGWWDVSQETSYVNTDPVTTFLDWSGAARNFSQTTVGSKPLYTTSVFPLGGAGLAFDGVSYYMSAAAISNFIANTAYSAFIVVYIDAISTDAAATYSNDAIWADSGGFAGLHLRSTGPKAMAYNWDGTDDHADVTITTGAAHVIHTRHDSGNIYISIDGGTEVSVASANTTDLTNPFRIGLGLAGTYFQGKIGELFVYNQVRSPSEVTALINSLTTKWITGGDGPTVIPTTGRIFAAGAPLFATSGLTVVASDSFNRADGDIGTADVGGVWVNENWGGSPPSHWVVASNEAKLSSLSSQSGEANAVLETGVADCTISLDVDYNATSSAGITFRYTDRTHWNLLGAGGGGLAFYKIIGASYIQVGSTVSGLFTPGNTYQLKVVLLGTSWTAYVDGVQQLAVTESNEQTATQHGLRAATDINTTFDNFLVTIGTAGGVAKKIAIDANRVVVAGRPTVTSKKVAIDTGKAVAAGRARVVSRKVALNTGKVMGAARARVISQKIVVDISRAFAAARARVTSRKTVVDVSRLPGAGAGRVSLRKVGVPQLRAHGAGVPRVSLVHVARPVVRILGAAAPRALVTHVGTAVGRVVAAARARVTLRKLTPATVRAFGAGRVRATSAKVMAKTGRVLGAGFTQVTARKTVISVATVRAAGFARVTSVKITPVLVRAFAAGRAQGVLTVAAARAVVAWLRGAGVPHPAGYPLIEKVSISSGQVVAAAPISVVARAVKAVLGRLPGAGYLRLQSRKIAVAALRTPAAGIGRVTARKISRSIGRVTGAAWLRGQAAHVLPGVANVVGRIFAAARPYNMAVGKISSALARARGAGFGQVSARHVARPQASAVAAAAPQVRILKVSPVITHVFASGTTIVTVRHLVITVGRVYGAAAPRAILLGGIEVFDGAQLHTIVLHAYDGAQWISSSPQVWTGTEWSLVHS